MGARTSHPPGTFSWVDLATDDVPGAIAFYTALFGWEAEAEDAGDGGSYTTCRHDGARVGGIAELSSAAGVPPSWTSYVTVADAAAATARAVELGAAVRAEPFDVLDAGRMAVLADPQGAAFAVWEPRARIGAERVNDIGCLCMNELATNDLDGARAFYEGLFGWRTEVADTGPGGPPMVFAYNGETLNASFSAGQEGAPSHWRPYFTVASTEETVAHVRELGGTVEVEPLELPDGSIALVLDPRGALFGVFAGEVDP